jgi:hypothetical protein
MHDSVPRVNAMERHMRRILDIASVLACQLRQFVGALNPVCDIRTYRPERHYMRGPGPKWHEKHSSRQVTSAGLR